MLESKDPAPAETIAKARQDKFLNTLLQLHTVKQHLHTKLIATNLLQRGFHDQLEVLSLVCLTFICASVLFFDHKESRSQISFTYYGGAEKKNAWNQSASQSLQQVTTGTQDNEGCSQ